MVATKARKADRAAAAEDSARAWLSDRLKLRPSDQDEAWRAANAAFWEPLRLDRPPDARRLERNEARDDLVRGVQAMCGLFRALRAPARVLEPEWESRDWGAERDAAERPEQHAYCDVFAQLGAVQAALGALSQATGRPQLPASTSFRAPRRPQKRGERHSVALGRWEVSSVRRAWAVLTTKAECSRPLSSTTATVLSVALRLEDPVTDDWDRRIETWKKRLRTGRKSAGA